MHHYKEIIKGYNIATIPQGELLDEKVIYSAINFWFKDEDAGTGKVWNYFKEI